MKKLFLLFAAIGLSLALVACSGEELPTLPDTVDMANVDEYLGRPDVQYVDLRNFDEKMKNGYIMGFEVIPFFDYLEDTEILVRTDGNWDFATEDLLSQGALEDLFDSDKAVFLMCGSGTRAGYVQDALESIGFETVYNVGGFADYDGANAVTGDGVYETVFELPAIPDAVDMDNIDDYLGRPDVQYVDLRNFDDKMASGYIAGFEFIPFFDYLEAEGILVRTDGNFDFAAEDILSQAALRGLFDEDKTIFLMCGSGTRAGYVLDALESLGYENLVNIGGFSAYDGDNEVLGDGEFKIDTVVAGDYTPGTYYGIDPMGGYIATVIVNDRGGIGYVKFDAFDGDSTKQVEGYDYGMVAFGGADYEWFEHANMLAEYIVANQGWAGINLTETAIDPAWNALTVPHHIIEFDADNNPDSIAGVTIGAEGFVLSWNDAIAQASATDMGVVTVDATPEDWAAAHAPAFDYVDGVYFGMDEEHGYIARVTIVGGEIHNVFFDALTTGAYLGCVDPLTGDPDPLVDEATCDDYLEAYETTTKQVLGFGYNMKLFSGGTYEWFEMANMLGAAIVDAQEWSAAWVIIPGTEGEHDKFDMTDTDTMDAVGGVTIGIEGFKLAFDEAMAQAVPVPE